MSFFNSKVLMPSKMLIYSNSGNCISFCCCAHLPDENPNSSRCCAWQRKLRLRMSESLEIHLRPARENENLE